MNKARRIQIQAETNKLVDSTRKYKYDTKFTKFYEKKGEHPSGKAGNIEVVNMDTLEAVGYYQKKHNVKFCGLVMANAFNPGGGYLNGAGAQEESVARRTNLHRGLTVIKYPLPKFGGMYCKDLFVFRDKEYNDCKFIEEYKCDAVLVAAFSRPPLTPDGLMVDKFANETRRKIDSMFEECLSQGCHNLVLGALGCGAFRNPPAQVAQIFNDALSHYRYKFDNIIFAIIDNDYTDNYGVFSDVLL